MAHALPNPGHSCLLSDGSTFGICSNSKTCQIILSFFFVPPPSLCVPVSVPLTLTLSLPCASLVFYQVKRRKRCVNLDIWPHHETRGRARQASECGREDLAGLKHLEMGMGYGNTRRDDREQPDTWRHLAPRRRASAPSHWHARSYTRTLLIQLLAQLKHRTDEKKNHLWLSCETKAASQTAGAQLA
ncbi:hypothetical protein F2P79_005755 [Pimephales promelas]|nr:hypothetical protein F2P79_005755 [Pimephales promelas]